jgi:uncharacterized protein YdeI (YjbR/CyaY-like superfamily)
MPRSPRRPSSKPAPAPRHFRTGAAFRAWLERHHRRPAGLLVGFHRKASNKGGLSYPEALDAALCFGWIDGPRRGLGPTAYSIQFSPRRPGSIWSRVNVAHVERLRREGRMTSAGEEAFARRDPKKTGSYSFERPAAELAPAEVKRFRADARAWAFFQAQPPGWRKTVVFWIVSARRPGTRTFRLEATIALSARGERVSLLRPPSARRSAP